MKEQDLVLEAVKAIPVLPKGATHILDSHGQFELAKEQDGKMFVYGSLSLFDQKHWKIACTREQHIRLRAEFCKDVKVKQLYYMIDEVIIPRPTPEELAYIAEIDSKNSLAAMHESGLGENKCGDFRFGNDPVDDVDFEIKKPISLRVGHYVRTKNIKDDEQYEAVCESFVSAGCEFNRLYDGDWRDFEYVGWCFRDGLHHNNHSGGEFFTGSNLSPEELTPEQVLSSVKQEIEEWRPEVGQECLITIDEFNLVDQKCMPKYLGEVIVFEADGEEFGCEKTDATFKPLKTEAEKEREQLIAQGCSVAYGSFNASHTTERNCVSIAEAFINAGWRPKDD